VPWPVRRNLISAFLAVHLAAVATWNLCPPRPGLRDSTWGARYLVPLGLWQYWNMFAPNPMRKTFALEADVVDARGGRHRFAFPRLIGVPPWRSLWGYRHAKYAHCTAIEGGPAYREFAARHAVRRLGLPTGSFPIEVRLLHLVRPTPPPGGPPDRQDAKAVRVPLGTYRFRTPEEVRP
jgi:hypothetical protein